MLRKIKSLKYNGHLVSVKFFIISLAVLLGGEGSVDFLKVVWSVW